MYDPSVCDHLSKWCTILQVKEKKIKLCRHNIFFICSYILLHAYTNSRQQRICIPISLLHASLNVSLTQDGTGAGVPLPLPPPPPPPPAPLLLLFGNSQMKNMAASHSTWLHVPELSSSTQLEFLGGDTGGFSSSSWLQAVKPCRGLESAKTWRLVPSWWQNRTKSLESYSQQRTLQTFLIIKPGFRRIMAQILLLFYKAQENKRTEKLHLLQCVCVCVHILWVCDGDYLLCHCFEPALLYKLSSVQPDWRIPPWAGWCRWFLAWPGFLLSVCSSLKPLRTSWTLSPAGSTSLLFPSDPKWLHRVKG